MNLIQYLQKMDRSIQTAKCTGPNGDVLDVNRAVDLVVDAILKHSAEGKKIMFVGNGGSSSIASHMSVDFWKNGGIHALSFNDPAQLTCLSNDFGYENVFAYPVDRLAEEGDMLAAISSSGSSPNILKAVDTARAKKCLVFTFSGFKADNPLRAKGDINIFIDDPSYGIVESAHALLCHYILDTFIQKRKDA